MPSSNWEASELAGGFTPEAARAKYALRRKARRFELAFQLQKFLELHFHNDADHKFFRAKYRENCRVKRYLPGTRFWIPARRGKLGSRNSSTSSALSDRGGIPKVTFQSGLDVFFRAS